MAANSNSIEIKLKFLTERLDAIQGSVKELEGLKRSALSTKSALEGLVTIGALKLALNQVTAAFAEVKKAIDLGGELSDLSARTGQTVSDLVVLQQAFRNAGIDAGATGQMLNLLQKSLTGVNENGEPTSNAFERLGLSLESLKSQSAVQQLESLSAAFTEIQNPADRTRIAMGLFGRSGGQMLAVLSDSSAMGVARQQVGSLGDTMEKNAAAFDKLGDSWDAIGLRMTQLFAGIAEEVAPMLQHIADSANSMDLTEAGKQIGDLALALTQLLQIVTPVAIALGSKFLIEGTINKLVAFASGVAASTAAVTAETSALAANTAAQSANAASRTGRGMGAAFMFADYKAARAGGATAAAAAQTAKSAAAPYAAMQASQTASIINANAKLAELAKAAQATGGAMSGLGRMIAGIGGTVGVAGVVGIGMGAEAIKAAQRQDLENQKNDGNKQLSGFSSLAKRAGALSGSEEQAKLMQDILSAMGEAGGNKPLQQGLQEMYDRVSKKDGGKLDAATLAKQQAADREAADYEKSNIRGKLSLGLTDLANAATFEKLSNPEKLQNVNANLAAANATMGNGYATPEEQEAAAKKILELTQKRADLEEKIKDEAKKRPDRRKWMRSRKKRRNPSTTPKSAKHFQQIWQ
ncbi:MAG: hypothetical protein D4R65_10090 [Verrucomicrobiaceae bacterium]|nr:MAG: hypothetical protein D4R65_10090 [Verrucomicrobiaceae bacterium]